MGQINKQQLARARNTNKWLLTGSYKPYNTQALTPNEMNLILQINTLRTMLIDEWDNNSVTLGLNVRPKCWCGKNAKYNTDYTEKLVCKKHINKE